MSLTKAELDEITSVSLITSPLVCIGALLRSAGSLLARFGPLRCILPRKGSFPIFSIPLRIVCNISVVLYFCILSPPLVTLRRARVIAEVTLPCFPQHSRNPRPAKRASYDNSCALDCIRARVPAGEPAGSGEHAPHTSDVGRVLGRPGRPLLRRPRCARLGNFPAEVMFSRMVAI